MTKNSLRGGAETARLVHTQEVAGLSPAPATNVQGRADRCHLGPHNPELPFDSPEVCSTPGCPPAAIDPARLPNPFGFGVL